MFSFSLLQVISRYFKLLKWPDSYPSVQIYTVLSSVHKMEREEFDICIIDNLLTVSFATNEKKKKKEGNWKKERRGEERKEASDERKKEGINKGREGRRNQYLYLGICQRNNSDCTHCTTFPHYCAAISRDSQL
jgi:hypothetical protein